MEKEIMIKAIYEKIADKTLSFGCVYSYYSNEWNLLYDTIIDTICNEWIVDIIWHSVMIWDVLDYIDSIEFNHPNGFIKWNQEKYPIIIDTLFTDWDYKRKPIEEQSEECIEYIYNLIK